MIYIISESVMVGTVTTQSYTCGIEAPTFKDAKDFLRAKMIEKSAQIPEDNESVLSYTIPQPPNNGGISYIVIGYMKSEPLTMMK